MADDDSERRRGRALIEVSPEMAERLRDPRVLLAILAGIGGAVALLIGYIGVSRTLDPAKQLPYLISGGVGGLFLLGVAAALLFSADTSATRDEVVEVRQAVERLAERLEELNARLDGAPAVDPVDAVDAVGVVDGTEVEQSGPAGGRTENGATRRQVRARPRPSL